MPDGAPRRRCRPRRQFTLSIATLPPEMKLRFRPMITPSRSFDTSIFEPALMAFAE